MSASGNGRPAFPGHVRTLGPPRLPAKGCNELPRISNHARRVRPRPSRCELPAVWLLEAADARPKAVEGRWRVAADPVGPRARPGQLPWGEPGRVDARSRRFRPRGAWDVGQHEPGGADGTVSYGNGLHNGSLPRRIQILTPLRHVAGQRGSRELVQKFDQDLHTNRLCGSLHGLSELAGQLDPVAPPTTTVARQRCHSVSAAASSSVLLTAAHTCSASPTEYSDSVRWARPGCYALHMSGLVQAAGRYRALASSQNVTPVPVP